MLSLVMRNLFFISMLVSLSVYAENWPQWRGPAFNGSSPETGLPSEWSQTNNVVWSVSLPGPSAATPVIWNDNVFISSTDTTNRSLVAICIDRKTGNIKWQNKVADGLRKDDRSTFSSSSPITDGKKAIFFYSTGDLVAFDMNGKELWKHQIQKEYGPFAFLWTFSSTPLLYENVLYLQVLQRNVPVGGRGRTDGPNDSYLLALDADSGKELWKQIRPSDAVAESRESYATPIPFIHDNRKEILVIGGDCITGHLATTGEELWRWGTWNPSKITHWRLVPSPVTSKDLILACGPKESPVFAVKAGGTKSLDNSWIAWNSRENRTVTADVPTPLFYENDFFVLSDLRRSLTRVEAATGKIKWTIETPGRAKYEASPAGADGKIYIMNFKGEVTVVKAEDGTIINTIPMAEPSDNTIRSTIAIAHKQLFIRTNQKLFCIGNAENK